MFGRLLLRLDYSYNMASTREYQCWTVNERWAYCLRRRERTSADDGVIELLWGATVKVDWLVKSRLGFNGVGDEISVIPTRRPQFFATHQLPRLSHRRLSSTHPFWSIHGFAGVDDAVEEPCAVSRNYLYSPVGKGYRDHLFPVSRQVWRRALKQVGQGAVNVWDDDDVWLASCWNQVFNPHTNQYVFDPTWIVATWSAHDWWQASLITGTAVVFNLSTIDCDNGRFTNRLTGVRCTRW